MASLPPQPGPATQALIDVFRSSELRVRDPSQLLFSVIGWARTLLDEDTPPARRNRDVDAEGLARLVADYLVEMAPDVNATDEYHRSPLFILMSGPVSECHSRLAELLLQAGAEPSRALNFRITAWPVEPSVDKLYLSCLDREIATSLEPLISTMKAAGAIDVNEQDVIGNTALHLLCGATISTQCTATKIKSLTGLGADPNSVNAAGETPLHHLLAYGNTKQGSVRALLEAGADPALVPDLYRYVHSAVNSNIRKAVITLLEDSGAPPCPAEIARDAGLGGPRQGL